MNRRRILRGLAILSGCGIALGCTGTWPATLPTTNHTPLGDATFFDDFDRPDTASGLGPGWDMRGGYVDRLPLPAADDGYVRGGMYTYAGNATVYAVRQFQGQVRRMGSTGRWTRIRDGGTETNLAMAITPNDMVVADMVHFGASRAMWELTVRRAGGAFEPVANGRFEPMLDIGKDYHFEMEASDSKITLRIPGHDITSPVSTAGLLGDRAFWEEFVKPAPAAVIFEFDSVWADQPSA